MIDKHDRIFELAEQIHNLQNVAAAQTRTLYENEVEQIIQRDIKDEHRIERILDQLLDVAFDDKVLVLFKKLCRHLYFFNPDASSSYVNSCFEMWDEENHCEN
ncbi:MAG: hypothetical protein PF904_13735 [Kiritimatiellae bacterium]|jgi:CRISPR/Cas system Type II protein with McrA/HNH and RuvC-like nuclease domain|nr:hypothetical protein [Kiritimatiellia bacterium]